MNRLEKEALEAQQLHPAALQSSESRGREFAEIPDAWRTRFERDRDRIIHSKAFRRMMYKTQVFINHVGDNQRTRMTHSLEVQQVSRSLASALNLNEPLCEALAISHDLGHAPFGHAGERALNALMQDAGGFSHNKQSLRVVDVLENRSPDYLGLNLTHEVKEGLKKHQEIEDADSGETLRHPSLEAMLVDHADSTAYHFHDVDDGLREGILDPMHMDEHLELWNRSLAESRKRHPNLKDGQLLWRRTANELLGQTIGDLQIETQRRLDEFKPSDTHAAQTCSKPLIGHSPDFAKQVGALHKYLYEHLYFRDEVNWHIRRSTDLLEHLFCALQNDLSKVPKRYFETAESNDRAVCDYVSGMTDRYVEKVARELGVLPSY